MRLVGLSPYTNVEASGTQLGDLLSQVNGRVVWKRPSGRSAGRPDLCRRMGTRIRILTKIAAMDKARDPRTRFPREHRAVGTGDPPHHFVGMRPVKFWALSHPPALLYSAGPEVFSS